MEEKIAKIKKETVKVVQTYFTEDIDRLLADIEELEKNPALFNNPSWLEELSIYRALLLFVDFPTLSEDLQIKLFKESLLKAIRVGIDIKERFAIKMNVLDSSLWPETAQVFLEALTLNEEKIGRENILVEGEPTPSLPSVKNWLRDYNRIYGMEKHDRMIIHKYMTENKNVAKLNQLEKMVLLKVIEFYESLKFPTQSQFAKAFEDYLNQSDSDLELIEESLGLKTEALESNLNDSISALREEMLAGKGDVISDRIDNLMKKFPKVADQEITEKPIKLIYSGEVVRPTVENWLSDYSSFAGAEGREINDRSNYLLRSPNALDLKLEERVRLGLILRSVDEGYPLPCSSSQQKVLFNVSN